MQVLDHIGKLPSRSVSFVVGHMVYSNRTIWIKSFSQSGDEWSDPASRFEMSHSTLSLVCLLTSAAAFASERSGDWPCWRGPKLDGSGAGSNAPIVWSEKINVAWKSLVPGRGHSSPIVIGDRIILTTAEELPQRQYALCYQRKTGQRIWETTVHQTPHIPT